MAQKVPERFGIQPHAIRKSANRQVVAGVVLLVIGGASAAIGIYGVTIFAGAIGGLLVWLGLKLRRDGAAAQILNRAYHSVTIGEVEDAELLHGIVAQHRLSAPSRRSLDLQRCILAIRAGELDAARAHCELALAPPGSWLNREHERNQRLAAYSYRAFVRAAQGDADGALEDALRVRDADLSAPDSLARVELAVAISLQKGGQRGELRAHLREHRHLLANYTNARERGLVRGLERMLAVSPESAYRKPAEKDPSKPDGWLAKVLPSVASFVPAQTDVAPLPDTSGSPEETKRAHQRLEEAGKAKHKSQTWKVVALWVLLVVLLVFVYLLLSGDPPPDRGPSDPMGGLAWITVWLGAGATALFLGMVAVTFRRNLRAGRRLIAAMALRARGDAVGARRELLAIADGKTPMLAAGAKRQLATLSFHEGDLAAARDHADEGVAVLSEQQRAFASDMLFPSLLEERAVLLAADGDSDDAAAELAMLLERCASYPFAERARRRVLLMNAVQAGDLAAAARIGDATIDVTFSEREDLLVDLARALVPSATVYPGEVDRLKDLLEADSSERAWLDAVAPDLLEAFDAQTT